MSTSSNEFQEAKESFDKEEEGSQNNSEPLPSEEEFSDLNDANQGFFKPSETSELEPYPSWCSENGASVTTERIKEIFSEICDIFGFQVDNSKNMYDFFMTQMDSRASRMNCINALLSLHADYIGGDRSNYKKWYFVALYELDEGLTKAKVWNNYKKYKKFISKQKTPIKLSDLPNHDNLIALDYKWKERQRNYSEEDYIIQISIYLHIWGEANNVRFLPECICFIFTNAMNYYYSTTRQNINFLDDVITPIYKFIKLQQYKLIDGEWVKNHKDHNEIIGYDDINQFFWFPENLAKIKLFDKSLLFDYPKPERMLKFAQVDWNSFLYKTYREKRSWFHLLTNFSRVWIIHVTVFWYYTSFNSSSLYTKDYSQLLDNQPPSQVRWTIVSLGGTLSCLIAIMGTLFEYSFVVRKFPGSPNIFGRLILLTILMSINVAPSIYILGFIPWDVYSKHGRIIGITQFVISLLTFIYLSIQAPSKYFETVLKPNGNYEKTKVFTASFPKLSSRGQTYSLTLWITVFLLKFFESYIFLTLSFKDPIRILSSLDLSRCRGDVIFSNLLCQYQGKILLGLLLITDLMLFFLDTYLWYVICNCIFSIFLSFSLGISIFTPWRNIFVRLPERIYNKLVFIDRKNSNNQMNLMQMVSQIWNGVVISMYREHLLSLEQVNKLVYHYLDQDEFNSSSAFNIPMTNLLIRAPLFFVFQDDNAIKLDEFFEPGKEAERRISFFAQSLSCPIPEPIPTSAMPCFTVLVPHYSEKILLSLKEIIKEDKGSKVSILDYLKQINPRDWENFVHDSKILNALSENPEDYELNKTGNEGMQGTMLSPPPIPATPSPLNTVESHKSIIQDKFDNLPYYYIGFKTSSPRFILRTRIWASLRSQTLYRTISGFMNYEKAIKILYQLENPQYRKLMFPEMYESEINMFVQRKFNLLVTLQRYQNFDKEELNNVKFLLEAFPTLKACYLEEEIDENSNEVVYYSTLLDTSQVDAQGNFIKKYRIRLSGSPILGDGKSDNQNHALIFYRGEYIQVIDANQDNYLEECLKIKSVLAEFEEYSIYPATNYIPGIWSKSQDSNQVAFIGAREYIFSENIGVLGDIAAAKEQTFGTLFARTLAEIGGKLHYGHPDFLNGIFMTTRGGISKAQKGLHLNEDIYAGMMAICRGGRIKHCDYYQCGKGRDLGFGTILNFTIKIGAGMGEQILSREHYYLGISLPIDQFLSFYYAHAGFHINNLLISLSASLFMIVLTVLGSLNNEIILCNYDVNKPITDFPEPLGCYNLEPVLHWVSNFVVSVFICFFISFVPLLFQELIEKGIFRAFLRILYHLISLSPFFEVFVCQIYAKSLKDNLSFGGAKYIATGRGFATSRLSFPVLFSRYATLSMYSGSIFFLTVMFATITMWQPSILWFYISFISMCLAPIIFNPHQFSWSKFFIDYRELLRWFTRGNSKSHENSWYKYQKLIRVKYLGYKKLAKGDLAKSNHEIIKRISLSHKIMDQVLVPLVPCLIYLTSFLFINAQTGVQNYRQVNPLLRIGILTALPIIMNLAMLAVTFCVSCILGPILRFRKFALFTILLIHCLAIIIIIVTFQILSYLESWNVARTLMGIITIISLHKLLRGVVYTFIVTKELKHDRSNTAWYSGRWIGSNLGVLIITQPFRELIIKVIEMISFGYDFILCHGILLAVTPILLLPFIDKLHTLLLFWSKSSRYFRNPILSKKQMVRTRVIEFEYATLYVVVLVSLTGLITVPFIVSKFIPEINTLIKVSPMVMSLFQPNHQNNNDTGENAPSNVIQGIPALKPIKTVA